MNKKLMAVAVAGALTAPGLAVAQVGGTPAWFQLETGVWPDGRLDNAASSGEHFGGRNSAVGFSSAAGDVLFGIWDTPYKVTYGTANLVTSGGFASSGIIMGNGDSTGALPNAQCATGLNNGSGTPTAGANSVCATE